MSLKSNLIEAPFGFDTSTIETIYDNTLADQAIWFVASFTENSDTDLIDGQAISALVENENGLNLDEPVGTGDAGQLDDSVLAEIAQEDLENDDGVPETVGITIDGTETALADDTESILGSPGLAADSTGDIPVEINLDGTFSLSFIDDMGLLEIEDNSFEFTTIASYTELVYFEPTISVYGEVIDFIADDSFYITTEDNLVWTEEDTSGEEEALFEDVVDEDGQGSWSVLLTDENGVPQDGSEYYDGSILFEEDSIEIIGDIFIPDGWNLIIEQNIDVPAEDDSDFAEPDELVGDPDASIETTDFPDEEINLWAGSEINLDANLIDNSVLISVWQASDKFEATILERPVAPSITILEPSFIIEPFTGEISVFGGEIELAPIDPEIMLMGLIDISVELAMIA